MLFLSTAKSSPSLDSGVEFSTLKARRHSSSTIDSLGSLPDVETGNQRYAAKIPQTGTEAPKKRCGNACDYCKKKKSKVRIAPTHDNVCLVLPSATLPQLYRRQKSL